MPTAEEMQKSIVELKAKVVEAASAKAPAPEVRAARKRLKRAQRRLRQATGKKLATIRKHKKGAEDAPTAAPPAASGEAKK